MKISDLRQLFDQYDQQKKPVRRVCGAVGLDYFGYHKDVRAIYQFYRRYAHVADREFTTAEKTILFRLVCLSNGGWLTETPRAFITNLWTMLEAEPTPENRVNINITHDLLGFVSHAEDMRELERLSPDIWDKLYEHRVHILNVDHALFYCGHRAGSNIFTAVNSMMSHFLKHAAANGLGISELLHELNEAHLLTPENVHSVLTLNSAHAEEVRHGVYHYHAHYRHGFTQENFNDLLHHAHCANQYAYALCLLQKAELLTPDNREIVSAHTSGLKGLAALLVVFFECSLHPRLLTQREFELMIDCSARFSHTYIIHSLHRLPDTLRIPIIFTQLIRLSEQDEIIRFLQDCIQQDNEISSPPEVMRINYNESAQNAAVEKSILEALEKLKSRYQAFLKDRLAQKKTIRAIRVFAEQLEDEKTTTRPVRTCIQWLLTNPHTEIQRNALTLKQTLLLVFHALHDETARVQPMDRADCYDKLIQSLDHIQRSKNKDEKGNDLGGADETACVGGTFNKLVDTLNKIHVDVEIIFKSRESAGYKVIALTQQAIDTYLWSLSGKTLEEQLSAINVELLHEIPALRQLFEEAIRKPYLEEFPEFSAELVAWIDVDLQSIIKKHRTRQTPLESPLQTPGVGLYARSNTTAEPTEIIHDMVASQCLAGSRA